MSAVALALFLGIAPGAFADSTHTTTSGGDVTVTATGGAGGDGGSAHSDANSNATGIGFGGDASNRTNVDTNVKNTNVNGNSNRNTSVSGASSNQKQGQGQDQGQSQDSFQQQGISAFNGNTTTVEAPDVKGMGKELAKHADEAARSQALSGGNITPCGDVQGAAGQGGLFGFSVGTVSETCKAFRLQQLEALNAERKSVPYSTRLAETEYYVAFLPRLVLNICSFGILN
jgi:hypothetical protein